VSAIAAFAAITSFGAFGPLPPDVRVVQLHGPDAGFVATKTSSGTPIHWAGSCVFLRRDARGTAQLSDQDVDGALAQAAGAWQAAAASCGYLQFRFETPDTGTVGLDYVNRVIFDDTTWCGPGPTCYDPAEQAVTTVFFVDKPGDPRDGTILDADIELDAVNDAFAICDSNGANCTTAGTGPQYDLANTLTHELGHVIGLDHTCWNGRGAQPVDDTGAPVPSCLPGPLPPAITEATMYPFQALREVKKRSPEADDVAGSCARYPLAQDPMACAPVTPPGPTPDAGPADAAPPPSDADAVHAPGRPGGCCQAGASGPPVVLALVPAAWWRRRRAKATMAARCLR
jgi:hypothetical protein